MQAAKYVELTQRGVGYGDGEGSRLAGFDVGKSAVEFVDMNSLGFVRLGIAQGRKLSDGLEFTGLDAQDVRTDLDNTSLEQPFASRKQWDNT